MEKATAQMIQDVYKKDVEGIIDSYLSIISKRLEGLRGNRDSFIEHGEADTVHILIDELESMMSGIRISAIARSVARYEKAVYDVEKFE